MSRFTCVWLEEQVQDCHSLLRIGGEPRSRHLFWVTDTREQAMEDWGDAKA
jgi:hypothetical protein